MENLILDIPVVLKIFQGRMVRKQLYFFDKIEKSRKYVFLSNTTSLRRVGFINK